MSTEARTQASGTVRPSALGSAQIISRLAQLQGWNLYGAGPTLAIEKSFVFTSYLQTLSFVNAVAFIAERQDHHPDMLVKFNRCSVRFRTHDAKGISTLDFSCAAQVDALINSVEGE